jgi:hypothetical protein
MVGHGKLLRALAAQWLTGDVALGSVLAMEPATISVLEHDSSGTQVRLWNFSAVSLPSP